MNYTDVLTDQITDADLRNAFRAYFGELGVKVTNWEGLFDEISNSPDCILVRKEQQGRIVGFLMFVSCDEVSIWNGFFTTKVGCIEEFWTAPEFRGQGHGTGLLRQAEEWLARDGCAYTILTTDTAPDFYIRNGYMLHRGIRAKNRAAVYMKQLIR